MKRRSRELNVFSMSALDLFASALGAFIFIAVILFPYYLKTHTSPDIQALQQTVQILEKEVERSIQFALLGIASRADSFVIVIDMSGSMEEYTQPMQETVAKLLEPMKVDHKIQILGFQGESSSPNLPHWQTPYQLISMSDYHKRQAKQYVKKLAQQFGGGTPTLAALEKALDYPSEAIILITDGAPNGNPNTIIRTITGKNQGQKEIHCIALGEYHKDKKLTDFLQRLAENNRGGFLGVAN